MAGKDRAVIILGPTGVGKSEFAIKLAKLFDGEIISADSVQIYHGLDIGSAKISEKEMQGIKHHCIDFLPPEADFSVFEFVEKTRAFITDICSRNKLPIICGGTGLYIKALIEGYDFGGSGRVQEFREKLWQIEGEELHNMLKELNPERASEISPSDKKKIIRAIEIAKFGTAPGKSGSDINFLPLALTLEREKLYEKINARVDKMIRQGLIEEVKALKERGLSEKNQSMQAIGYKETLAYLNGALSLEEMSDLIKQHTRNYAKRQMTFLRGMKIKMFDRQNEDEIIEYVRGFYDNK